MDEAKLELVRDWLTRASHDLGAARALSALAQPLLDAAIYHCQQAAEKALKGWLQLQDDPFPKTHDIEVLVNQAAKLEDNFKQFATPAAVLTPYVSAFRYPGGSAEPMPSREDTISWLAASRWRPSPTEDLLRESFRVPQRFS